MTFAFQVTRMRHRKAKALGLEVGVWFDLGPSDSEVLFLPIHAISPSSDWAKLATQRVLPARMVRV